ncbi:hypothetical protein K431DRAFT_331771 [Polychaeton citri CBS 116435]|uniref:Mid2 domain-containing protein n=1 Tax=Polychaeton citri CBS 116435 TaxID=1314669 RepID=A0A9P4ULZ9_9PEZI|nr:hypothetical protein K431DRAFT_331771 [Polychaeton citri CBS 116435]
MKLLVCLSLTFGIAFAQSIATPTPFQTLPPAPDYSDGQFTTPGVNVSWTSIFDSVNMYLIRNFDYANLQTIIINFDGSSYIYEFKVSNSSVPYNFRVVDSQGTADEQKTGGLASDQFWIRGVSSSSATSSTTPSPTTSGSSGRSVSHDASPTPSNSGFLTSSKPAVGATPTISQVPSITTSSSFATPSSVGSEQEQGKGADDGSNKQAVSTGTGIGFGVGVFVLLLVALISWRTCHKRRTKGAPNPQHATIVDVQPMPQHLYHAMNTEKRVSFYDGRVFEMSAAPESQTLAEAPSQNWRPAELAGRSPTYTNQKGPLVG